jgi:hypothetical protein
MITTTTTTIIIIIINYTVFLQTMCAFYMTFTVHFNFTDDGLKLTETYVG